MTLRSTKVGFDSHLWRAMTYMVPTCDFFVSIHQICGTSWFDPQLSTVRHIFYFPITVLLVQKTCSYNVVVLNQWVFGASNHQFLPKVIPVFRWGSSWMACIYQCQKKNDSQEINGINPSIIKNNMYVDVKNQKNLGKKKLKISKNPPVSVVASPRLFRLFRLFLLACISVHAHHERRDTRCPWPWKSWNGWNMWLWVLGTHHPQRFNFTGLV